MKQPPRREVHLWQGSPLRSALVRMRHPLTVLMVLGCSGLAAASGPFGTYGDMQPLARFALWSVLIGGSTVLSYLIYALSHTVLQQRETVRFRIVFGLFSIVANSSFVYLVLRLSRPGLQHAPPSWIELVFYITVISILIQSVRYYIPGMHPPAGIDDAASSLEEVEHLEPKTLTEPTPAPSCRLLERLERPVHETIEHISADGHFTLIRTSAGSHRIRMRFSDAVTEVGKDQGLMTHRSHWVAREAVEGWWSEGAKPYILLKTGSRVPISKTYREAVEAEGFALLSDGGAV